MQQSNNRISNIDTMDDSNTELLVEAAVSMNMTMDLDSRFSSLGLGLGIGTSTSSWTEAEEQDNDSGDTVPPLPNATGMEGCERILSNTSNTSTMSISEHHEDDDDHHHDDDDDTPLTQHSRVVSDADGTTYHYTAAQRTVDTTFQPLVNGHNDHSLSSRPLPSSSLTSSFGARDRFHHLENSFINLPEPGKVDRPNLGMIRASRFGGGGPILEDNNTAISLTDSGLLLEAPTSSITPPSEDSSKLSSPEEPKKYNLQHDADHHNTTLLAAAHQTRLAQAATADSSSVTAPTNNVDTTTAAAAAAACTVDIALDDDDSEMMRSGEFHEFAERCADLLLSMENVDDNTNTGSSSDDANNNNNNNNKDTTTSGTLDPITISNENLFRSDEFATLCSAFPALLGQQQPGAEALQQQQPQQTMSSMPNHHTSGEPHSYDNNHNIVVHHPITSNVPVQHDGVPVQSVASSDAQEQPQQPEAADGTTTAVVIPTERDVKCGRGGDTIQHNAHFIDLCEAMADAYAATRKRGMEGKQGIVLGIVHAIQEKQGRFLKRSTTTGLGKNGGAPEWQVLSIKDAENKTSHCIRDILARRARSNAEEGEQSA